MNPTRDRNIEDILSQQRLGQLIENVFGCSRRHGDPTQRCLFQMDDLKEVRRELAARLADEHR